MKRRGRELLHRVIRKDGQPEGVLMLDPGLTNFATITDNKGNVPIAISHLQQSWRSRWWSSTTPSLLGVGSESPEPMVQQADICPQVSADERKGSKEGTSSMDKKDESHRQEARCLPDGYFLQVCPLHLLRWGILAERLLKQDKSRGNQSPCFCLPIHLSRLREPSPQVRGT